MALAKMKRVFVVGPSDQKEMTLKFLQEAGVLHVEPAAKISGDFEKKNTAALQEVRRIGQIYEGVKAFLKGEEKASVSVPDADFVFFCEQKLAALQELRNRKQSLLKLISDLEVWGDFDLERLRTLEEEGVYVQRFRMEVKRETPLELPEGAFIGTVTEKPVKHFFTIQLGQPVDIPQATQLRLPEQGLKEARREFREITEREEGVLDDLSGAASRIDLLERKYLDSLDEASYTEHLGTLYSEGVLFGIQGWIPDDLEGALLKKMEASGLPLMARVRAPLEEEIPPTLFKNNWLVSRIEPLLKLYGLPAYRSIDPSYFFAPFMIFFFGICLGDAGYGVVLLLASIWIKRKWGHLSKDLPRVMKLCQAFSVAAILVGVITGSVFGVTFANREWILIDLDIDMGNPMILFYISLGLGLIHLSISYLLGILQARSRFDRLQRFGLMMVLWGGAVLISRSVWFSGPASTVNVPFQYTGWGLLLLGVLFTFLFASDSKKWPVRIGLGLWNVYGLTGLIGDLLSYARLFGLGIATTAIAAVMNQLAGMVYRAGGPYVGIFLAVLLLMMGHTFNLVLSVLGSTVHSARLHFVEAFKSFFEGGGIEYKPFSMERGQAHEE